MTARKEIGPRADAVAGRQPRRRSPPKLGWVSNGPAPLGRAAFIRAVVAHVLGRKRA